MTSNKRYWLTVQCLFIVAFAVRIIFLFQGKALTDQIWSDMFEYTIKADQVLDGIWKETHFFQSIGYSLMIALFKKNFHDWGFSLSSLQAILSFLTVYVVFVTATASFGRKIGLITLFFASVHLPWIVFINLALPETIFTFLLSVLAWLSLKIVTTERPSIFYSISWGLTFIAGFWLKGTHIFLLPLFFLGLLIYKRWQAIPSIIAMGLVFVIGASLHGALAFNKIGKFQLSSSTGGLNFIEGKCPFKNNRDSAGYSFLSPVYFQLQMMDEKKWPQPFTNSKYYMRQGLKCIQRNPTVLIQSFEAIPFLFIGNTLWPINQFSYSAPARLYEQIFAILVMCGLIFYGLVLIQEKDRWKNILIWILPGLSVCLCVYVFKSEIRYRIPFDVWFIPLSVVGWTKISPAFAGLKSLEKVNVGA